MLINPELLDVEDAIPMSLAGESVQGPIEKHLIIAVTRFFSEKGNLLDQCGTMNIAKKM